MTNSQEKIPYFIVLNNTEVAQLKIQNGVANSIEELKEILIKNLYGNFDDLMSWCTKEDLMKIKSYDDFIELTEVCFNPSINVDWVFKYYKNTWHCNQLMMDNDDRVYDRNFFISEFVNKLINKGSQV